ncbi:MAG TPA: hypothetical protein DDW56_25025, partial [Cyanobacteria bacterium UBA11366]|nr:hypothetical protein [Cyanobacteria bacterium UBA11366]
QRPNYFPGQYLLEDDFQLEQQYHIDRQRWHHHLLHVSGIGEGLKIDKIENALAVKVSEGSAINPQGQQIILLNSQQIDLTKIVSNTNTTISDGTYTLYIGYKPKLTEQQTTGLDTSSRRWQEDPDFQLTSTSSELQNYVPLAKLTIKNNLVSEIDNSIRAYSGLRLPTIDGEITLRSKSDGTKSLAELNSSLSILGTLSVTGNIGIGIANPSEKLEVSGNIKATGSITSSSLTVTGNTRIKGTTKDNTAAGLNVTNSDSNSLFYVRNDGNIGIGTTNPSAKLEISGGDLKISGNISATNQSLSGNLSVTGNIGIGTTSTGTSKLKIANSASDFAHILFNGSGMGELQFIGWSSGWNINTITAGKHLYLNRDSGTNSNVLIGCNGKELFVRGSDGNVGIGTTTPTVKLEISGGDLKVSGNISATNATLSGNVRIGATNSTGAKLEIAIDPTSEDTVLKAGGVSGSKASIELSGHVQLKEYGTANLAFLQARDDGSNRDIGLRIRTQKAGTTQQQIIEALTILPNGNVSIGTTNTAAKLQVQIDDTTADASLKLEHNGSNFIVRPLSAGGNSSIIENTGGGSLIINPTGGNVGIGTTTPNRTLTIKADYSATADAQQLLIQGATNTNYQLLLGYHTTNNYGSIQAMNQTVGVRPLVLNPAGGNVGIGATTPGAKLTIQTLNDYDGSTLRLEAKKEPSLYYLNLNTSAGNSIVKWIFNQTNNGTNYPNVLAFDRGQIGIGTPTPLQTLDVNGRIH